MYSFSYLEPVCSMSSSNCCCLTCIQISQEAGKVVWYSHLQSDHFQFTLIHGPNIPSSYAILFFTALDFTSITSYIHNWTLFLLWFYLSILSGVISLLYSSSILGIYWPGEFIFQCHIFLPFITVHEVLKARIQKWFAIPFSSGPRFAMTHPSWVALHGMAHNFIILECGRHVWYILELRSGCPF